MRSSRIVDTLEALAGCPVTIAHRILVHIPITVARLTQLNLAQQSGGIAVEAVRTRFALGPKVADGTLQANHRVIGHLHAGTAIGTRTPFTIVWRATQRVPVIPTSALIAGIASRVMLADTSSRFRSTNLGVFVAITGNTRHKGTAQGRAVPIAGRARFTELTQVALGTCTLFDPCGGTTSRPSVGRLQFHIVEIGLANHRIGGSDTDRRQVSQNGHESTSRLTWLPGVVVQLVQSERILAHLLVGQRMALREYGQGDAGAAAAFQYHIRIRRIRSLLTDCLEAEFEEPIVRSTLIAQETVRSRKINTFTALGRDAHILTELVVLEVNGDPWTACV